MTTVNLSELIQAHQTIQSLLAIPPIGLSEEQLEVRMQAAKHLGKLDAIIFNHEKYEGECA
jgi:hypothetical protein